MKKNMWKKIFLLVIAFNSGCSSVDSSVSETLTAWPTATVVKATTTPSPTLMPIPTLYSRLELSEDSLDVVVGKLEMEGYSFEYFEYEDGNSRYLGTYQNDTLFSITLDIRQSNFTFAGFYYNYSGNPNGNNPLPDVLDIAIFGPKTFEEEILPWRKDIEKSMLQGVFEDYYLLCFEDFAILENLGEPFGFSHSIYLRRDWELELSEVYRSCS
ncbi:MAG: hypothetical protein JNM55_12160 [Anaerolineales bacterium]|nr:hypothetical protein [Anaerolineales bacterium]